MKKFEQVPAEGKLRRRRQALLCVSALLLGALSMGVARLLLLAISFFTHLFYFQEFSFAEVKADPSRLGAWSVLVPVIGGLIVGLMARFGSKAIRGHGIPEAMDKILTEQSRIPPRLIFLKPLSSAIAIGSGGPFGAEGPIIATGGALGSWFGQKLKLSAFETKVLLACGAAGGMTAIFGTPVAAVLLSIELLLFEYRAQSFIPVALSAVMAAVLRSMLWTSHAFFEMGPLNPINVQQLPVYLASGVVFGFASILISKSIYLVEDLFEHLPIHWMWWPMLGGLAVGVIGVIEPLTLGVGYTNIQAGLDASLPVSAALLLCFWKFCSWTLALSSGTSGGTLAPLLTFGSLIGMALGLGIQSMAPGLDIDVHLLALIGMAAIFSGCSRALLASVIFAFECVRQPMGLVPLLGACSISYLISHWFMANTIMTEKIVRRGVKVPSEYLSQEH